MPRKTLAIIAGAVIAVGAIVWWICASGGQSSERMTKSAGGHVNQLEEAAEAADKAGGK